MSMANLIQTVIFERPLVVCGGQVIRFNGQVAEVYDEVTKKVVDQCKFSTSPNTTGERSVFST